MKLFVPLAIMGALVAGGVAAYVYLESPRMYVQPNVRPFQAAIPPLPVGVVPIDVSPTLPSAEDAKTLKNPAPETPENLAAGSVYYEYYCVFCHGDNGDGNGPVGQSYTPKPADLRSAKFAAYSDGQLLRAMLLGTGHEPVLERVVLPEHRWPLVQYIRQFTPTQPKP